MKKQKPSLQRASEERIELNSTRPAELLRYRIEYLQSRDKVGTLVGTYTHVGRRNAD